MMFKKNNSRTPLALCYFVLFAALEILITINSKVLFQFDHNIQNLVSPMVTPLRTSMFTVVSFLAGPAISLLLAMFIAILIYSKKRKVDAIWAGLTFLGGDAVAFIVKNVVRRPRPTDKVIPDSGFSFPSGHVFGLTLLVLLTIYLVLPYVKNSESRFVLGVLLVIWLAVVAFSRIYLRGHFASDVIGSVLLAGLWWKCAEMLYPKYAQRLDEFLELKLKKAN